MIGKWIVKTVETRNENDCDDTQNGQKRLTFIVVNQLRNTDESGFYKKR